MTNISFFYPDCTVATRVALVRVVLHKVTKRLVECTTDIELHNTPKDVSIIKRKKMCVKGETNIGY